eukprot:363974-Chlamydomonas_euryale.AAC.11
MDDARAPLNRRASICGTKRKRTQPGRCNETNRGRLPKTTRPCKAALETDIYIPHLELWPCIHTSRHPVQRSTQLMVGMQDMYKCMLVRYNFRLLFEGGRDDFRLCMSKDSLGRMKWTKHVCRCKCTFHSPFPLGLHPSTSLKRPACPACRVEQMTGSCMRSNIGHFLEAPNPPPGHVSLFMGPASNWATGI